ncbi:het-s domain-containing protein [Fusarium denticulatum]|uniref:Het-s domain-containing protein n=1 Tax=Fusarium denticulatum TaxID=48507 RepID=A0A8H5WRL0_9HYPO|nr:het-s domain-containing protein [Fusarium denticulatum]
MADAIGIAGLAIAVFDQLLKLGERTAQTIQDIRTFAEDLKHVSETIRREHGITTALKYLLFEKSPKYGGQMLFEQYGEEVQRTILSVVEELLDTLESAAKLLDRHCGSDQSWFSRESRFMISRSPSPSPSTSIVAPQPGTQVAERSSSTVSLGRKLRWSLYDKKSAKDIIDRYADRNNNLYRIVQLNSFASGIGVNLQHLENMQHNQAAKQLGFDETAGLQLLAQAATVGMADDFEISDDFTVGCTDVTRIEDRFVTFNKISNSYLQDTCEYKVNSNEIDHQTRSRLNGLVALLQQPKGQVFRIPKCIGWRFLPSTREIAFIFESPGAPRTQPQSLLRLFDDPGIKPSLQDKFNLAHNLATSISQLQMVQWVHESFRSENILFFLPSPTQDGPRNGRESVANSLDNPWILGFDFSRPESFFSHGFPDTNPDRDIYRHPNRQGRPTMTFSKWHDIYSLGVVLLEIGLWEPAIQQQHPRDLFSVMRNPENIRERLTKVARRRLPAKVGGKYTELVVACLTGDFGVEDDTKEDIQLQQAFRAQVIAVLAQIVKSI